VPKKKNPGTKHFRDERFLKALGQHCLRLRSQRGLSIDRLSKESDQLSTSAIQGLETGARAVTISTLRRYAQALDLTLRDIIEFDEDEPAVEKETKPKRASSLKTPVKRKLIAQDDPRVKSGAFKTLLPVYSLKAAAGAFGSGEAVEPEGWVEVFGSRRQKLDRQMFVAKAVGQSMMPTIQSGDWIVLRSSPSGTRQGKVVLAQYRGPADPDTGGSYAIKRYRSVKTTDGSGSSSSSAAAADSSWRHRQITLSPDNPDYEPIVLTPKTEGEFKIVAEYLFSL
jgi:transcriptional regulator with XRE-family HTH domain